MEHDARKVANELIQRATDSGRQLTPMQVQKLTYLCHSWMLGLYEKPMIKQPVVAWQYGPVITDVYGSLRRYGREPVRRLISFDDSDEPDFTTEESDLIDQVWSVYGNLSGTQLSRMTHASGTPWSVTYERSGKHGIVSDNLIEDFYKEKARNRG